MSVEQILGTFLSERMVDLATNLLVAVSGIVVSQFLLFKRQNVQRPRLILKRGGTQGLGRMSIIVKNDGYSDAEDIKIYFPDHEPHRITYLKKGSQTKDIAFAGYDLGRFVELKEKIIISYRTVWGKETKRCWPIIPMSVEGDEVNYATFGVKGEC